MAKNNSTQNENLNVLAGAGATAATTQNDTVEVLYQNLGGRWYAFSIIDDEVFMGSINPDSIDPLLYRG